MIEILLPPPHSGGQNEIFYDGTRFKVVFAGRRWGKTELGIALIIQGATTVPGLYWWVGLSWSSASMKRAWRLLKSRCSRVPGVNINNSEHEIRLPNGSEIWLRTAENPSSISGEGVRGVVVDEFTLMIEQVWTEHLRPTLSDFQGWALFIGVPKGKNWAYQLYARGLTGVPGWRAWRCPTRMNPFIKPEEVEAAREDLPERMFAQEYEADVLEGGGWVFRNVDECAVAVPSTLAEHVHHYITVGVDWGQSHDYTAMTAICSDCGTQLAVDRFNKIGWSIQRARLKAFVSRWRPAVILVEENSIGRPNLEALIEGGMKRLKGFKTETRSKSQIIQSLVLAFERHELKILPDKAQMAELEVFEEEISSTTGRARYSAPSGMNDDTVIALALAWHAACNRVTITRTAESHSG